MLEIRKIENIDQNCVRVIRDSFITVAREFNITKQMLRQILRILKSNPYRL